MITVQTWHTIRGMAAQGCSHPFIARTRGVSRKTVRRALKGDEPAPYKREPAVRVSPEAFRADVEAGIRRGLDLLRACRQMLVGGAAPAPG